MIAAGKQARDARSRIARGDVAEFHRLVYGDRATVESDALAVSLMHHTRVARTEPAWNLDQWIFAAVTWPLWRVCGSTLRRRALVVLEDGDACRGAMKRLRGIVAMPGTRRVFQGSRELRRSSHERQLVIRGSHEGRPSIVYAVAGEEIPEECYGFSDVIVIDADEGRDASSVRTWIDAVAMPLALHNAHALVLSSSSNGKLAAEYATTPGWTRT